MRQNTRAVTVSEADRSVLESWVRSSTTEQRLAQRARIVLALAAGESNAAVGRRLGVREATVSKWRGRFVRSGVEGLHDARRAGRPPVYDATIRQRLFDQLDRPPPKGYATWNGALLAKALGDVSARQVWRVLATQKIQLQRRRSWCISTDPEFAPKAADIVGLYLNPPEGALVLSVDEKPHIQALERAQGYLRLPNGRALTGFSHEYTRHGTTTLFAALGVSTGKVLAAKHTTRRRRREFLAFMNDLVAAHPHREIHVILDNLNTHKPKHDRWLLQHPHVHFHFTPTHASWLNQIECWFSILSRAALQGASFTSPAQLRQAIDDFIAAYNHTATPFEWTKQVVHAVHPKARYADLRH
jgi:transposase